MTRCCWHFLLNKIIKLGNFRVSRNQVHGDLSSRFTALLTFKHQQKWATRRYRNRIVIHCVRCTFHVSLPLICKLLRRSFCQPLFVKFHAHLFLHLQNVNRLLAVVHFVCVYMSYGKVTGWKFKRRCGPKTEPRWPVHIGKFSSRNLRTLRLKLGGAPSCGHTKLPSPWYCLISGIADHCISVTL